MIANGVHCCFFTFLLLFATGHPYPDSFPLYFDSQVAIFMSYNTEFLCSGTIIDFNTILTSQNRLYYSWGGIISPLVLNIKVKDRIYNVTKVTFHPEEDFNETSPNLALIEVDGTFPMRSIANLAKHSVSRNFCAVIGYNETIDESPTLKIAPVLDWYPCNDSFLCPISINEDLCLFDPGSALVCNGYLTGILDSILCQSNNYPDMLMFTNLLHYSNTIQLPSSASLFTPNIFILVILFVFLSN